MSTQTLSKSESLARLVEYGRKHDALKASQRRLIAKGRRMHPVVAREVFAQAEAVNDALDALAHEYGKAA